MEQPTQVFAAISFLVIGLSHLPPRDTRLVTAFAIYRRQGAAR